MKQNMVRCLSLYVAGVTKRQQRLALVNKNTILFINPQGISQMGPVVHSVLPVTFLPIPKSKSLV